MPAQPTLFGWLKGSANVKQERAKTKTAIAPHAAQRRGQDETACLKQHTDTAEFPRSTASQLEKQKRKAASMFMPQKLRQILPKRRRLEAQAKSQNMKQEHPRQSEVSQVFFLGSKHPAAIFALPIFRMLSALGLLPSSQSASTASNLPKRAKRRAVKAAVEASPRQPLRRSRRHSKAVRQANEEKD